MQTVISESSVLIRRLIPIWYAEEETRVSSNDITFACRLIPSRSLKKFQVSK